MRFRISAAIGEEELDAKVNLRDDSSLGGCTFLSLYPINLPICLRPLWYLQCIGTWNYSSCQKSFQRYCNFRSFSPIFQWFIRGISCNAWKPGSICPVRNHSKDIAPFCHFQRSFHIHQPLENNNEAFSSFSSRWDFHCAIASMQWFCVFMYGPFSHQSKFVKCTSRHSCFIIS